MENAQLVSMCILILSGAFALISLGLLLIRMSGAVKEATVLMTMVETTLTKVNHILDDINNKMEMLNAPVELFSGFFSKGGLKATLLSGLGLLTSMFRRKNNKKGEEKMKIGKFILGLGIGAAAGLLLAPKKGSELREDIKRESLKAYDQLKNMTKEDVEAMLGQTIETVKKSVDEFDLDVFKETTKEKLSDLETKLEEFANRVKETDQYMQVKESVYDLSDKVNSKIDEVKTKVLDATLSDEDLEKLENEIDDVEDKLEEMIEEIKD